MQLRAFLLRASAALCLCAFFAAVAAERGKSPEPFLFENMAERAGIKFRQINFATGYKYPFETLGGAVTALDYNNDGWVDLLFLNGAPSPGHVRTDPASFNCLYRNNGDGTFTDVTETSGLSGRGIKGYPQGVAVGDYDNDRFADIYVTSYGDCVLYHNNGDGTFTDVTAKAGVAMTRHPFKASACWLDADNDGKLDLFVTHYFQWTFEENSDDYCGMNKPGYRTYCTPDVFKPLPNVLFRNNGDGTFTDISELAGLNKSLGKGMGVAIADYDNDGRMDIFVTNDKMPNFLYHNEGGESSERSGWKPVCTPTKALPWSRGWDAISTTTTTTGFLTSSIPTWSGNLSRFSRTSARGSSATTPSRLASGCCQPGTVAGA